ncbi:hypothetical protein E3N88_01857 [Mikania micrantha]|uniref:S-acyltransferase n=1 Tax=Mikania micrantha TaxID=192012 RepID=A0A5N6Q432_9ASTR|nr:hypothetical protein E3N88_01857 [Mikania micrantha]
MYVVPPPKRSDPLSGSINGPENLRIYQAWKGSNIFFLQGRFVFGPDVRSLVLTIFLIVAPVSVFCVFVARKLVNDFDDNWGISVMVVVILFTIHVLVLLLLTSGRDPGIIPRNAHPPEPEGFDGNNEGSAQTPQLRMPRIKEVEVNGITVKIKYCDTCMLYRPPRCSHCSICNNCVERFDHHCPWVGQCIGVMMGMVQDDGTEGEGCCAGARSWQCRLPDGGWYDRRANPYNKGILQNFGEIFCTRIPTSKNKFRASVPKEPGIGGRLVGAGFVSPNMGKAVDDIEMGRKAVWGDGGMGIDHREGPLSDNIKEVGIGEMSPEIRTTVDEGDRANIIHARRSSWGRKSGSWEMSPEVLALASRMGGIGGSSGGGASSRPAEPKL